MVRALKALSASGTAGHWGSMVPADIVKSPEFAISAHDHNKILIPNFSCEIVSCFLQLGGVPNKLRHILLVSIQQN